VGRSQAAGKLLKRQLASEAQSLEQGARFAGATAGSPLRHASRLAEHYGGRPRDWVKVSSSAYGDGSGMYDLFQTHWYENITTGLRCEFKTKFPRAENAFGTGDS
jgi:hypothetical protein